MNKNSILIWNETVHKKYMCWKDSFKKLKSWFFTFLHTSEVQKKPAICFRAQHMKKILFTEKYATKKCKKLWMTLWRWLLNVSPHHWRVLDKFRSADHHQNDYHIHLIQLMNYCWWCQLLNENEWKKITEKIDTGVESEREINWKLNFSFDSGLVLFLCVDIF